MTELADAAVTNRSHRLIASRHPTIGVFDDLSLSVEDLRVAFLLEMATNTRLGESADRLGLLMPDEVLGGPTASIIMAAFLHTDERGGRFHDRRLGAWYAAFDLTTAIAETVFHNERRLKLSDAGFPNRIQVRELITDLDAKLTDIRGMAADRADLYDPDPDRYPVSQAFAAQLRWPGSKGRRCDGLIYDSVRRRGGENVCLFWPSVVPRPVVQGDFFDYAWNQNGELSITKATLM